jgi:glutathione S-transferase
MLTVHHLNQSRSHRVIWALEELGLPYEIVHYQREKNMLAPEALKKVHPLGKSPVIEDNGLILRSLAPFWSICRKPTMPSRGLSL